MKTSLDLARQLEAPEISVSDACVECLPTSVAERFSGGGVGFYFGPASPLSQAVGLGMEGPMEDAEFARMQEFFRSRNVPVSISLCPYADPSVLDAIACHSYRITHFEQTLVRELPAVEATHAVTVERVAPAGLREWARTVLAGFQEFGPMPEGMEDLFAVLGAATRAQPFLARVDGAIAGGGTVAIRGDEAICYGDSTLPVYRRRGVQSALISARLAAASSAGCQLAMACTAPGTASQRNYERAGFRIAYNKAMLAPGVTASSGNV
ncbi:MAG: GNAT family N-acetyltransferase [Acidobacteria bacterium]|nr:GNAT family N-acetyltransferase [Acidobacteriota bacterium]